MQEVYCQGLPNQSLGIVLLKSGREEKSCMSNIFLILQVHEIQALNFRPGFVFSDFWKSEYENLSVYCEP